MKWTRDDTGRFRQRPHYLDKELEQICEDAICGFLQDRHGEIRFPVSTADLTVLIEKAVDDLDSGCDLDGGVDGLTDFFPKKRPRVKIAARLQEPHFENRLRTTLTHEYGHVILHGFLFVIDDDLKKLFGGKAKATRNTCHRDHMHGGSVDWMEWQAGHVSVAILMPANRTRRLVSDLCEPRGVHAAVAVNSRSLNTSTRVYQALFTSGEWSGDLKAYPIDTTTGNVGTTPSWSAKTQVAAQNWDTGANSRQIITRNDTQGIPFRWDTSGADALTQYEFNRKVIHYQFCETCGVQPFARGTRPDGVQTVALNVRCLDGVDLDALNIKTFDGASL